MAGTGETLTHGELEEGSARLARWLVDRGLRRGDGIALLADNSARVFEVYWAAQRCGLMLTAVNHHLTARRGRLHRARLRREGAGRRRVAGPARRGRRRGGARGRAPARLRRAGRRASTTTTPRSTASPTTPLRRRARGRGDALLLGHHRAGRRASGRRCRERRIDEPGDADVAVFGTDVRLHARDRLPLPRAALPRRAAALHAPRSRRSGGTVVVMERFDAGGRAGRDRALPGHAQPVGADDVRADAQAPARGARSATTCRRCGSRSTPRRRARSTSSGR